MGVHSGEGTERDGDYYGTAVNRAARLMAVAHGGQIVCSQATAALADSAVTLRSLGEHRLRDLAAAEQIFQAGEDRFPPLRTVDVVPTNLPTVRTELVGRSEAVAAHSDLVLRERLLTLTGVGGVGKTRLALGVAASVAAEFADGCWLIELAPITGEDDVVNTVAAGMRAPSNGLDALVGYLAERQVLLLLDNCEHVIDAVADFVDAVLRSTVGVHVLTTSREPLGLDGEQVRRVQSLAVPRPDEELSDAVSAAAVRLFAERARAVAEGFTVDTDNVGLIVEICRQLDGIPLAIELAATRVRSMAPAEIERRLNERFRLLAGGSRRTQERHRTLQATVAWSHDLLGEDEQIVFRRLAVFPASFDLAAAEAVCGEGGLDVVDCALHLVDRSLVVYEPADDRYRLLETLRQFGADRLVDAGETDAVRARHGEYFLGLVERLRPSVHGAGYVAAAHQLEAELENLRATAEWCIEGGRWAALAQMCEDAWHFVFQAAPVDGAGWLRHVVDHGVDLDDQIVVDLLAGLAWIHSSAFADPVTAEPLAERSLELAATSGCLVSERAWVARAQSLTFAGSFAEAMDAAERALAAAEQRGESIETSTCLVLMSNALAGLGDLERSDQFLAAAVEHADRTGHPILIANVVIVSAARHVWVTGETDFAACLEVLSRYGQDIGVDGQNRMWLNLLWGNARLGLHHDGAAGDLADRRPHRRSHRSPARTGCRAAAPGHPRRRSRLHGRVGAARNVRGGQPAPVHDPESGPLLDPGAPRPRARRYRGTRSPRPSRGDHADRQPTRGSTSLTPDANGSAIEAQPARRADGVRASRSGSWHGRPTSRLNDNSASGSITAALRSSAS